MTRADMQYRNTVGYSPVFQKRENCLNSVRPTGPVDEEKRKKKNNETQMLRCSDTESECVPSRF